MKRIGVHERGGRQSCPYCHSEIGPRERVRACHRCGTKLHEECSRELTKCTVLGCGAKMPKPAPYTPTWVSGTRSTSASYDWFWPWLVLEAVFEVIFQVLLALI